jgi:hypothetical protein
VAIDPTSCARTINHVQPASQADESLTSPAGHLNLVARSLDPTPTQGGDSPPRPLIPYLSRMTLETEGYRPESTRN